MTKNMLTLTGLLALVGALGIWQFGFFSDVREHIERETAVTRAQAIVRNMEERARGLTDRTRELRIDARTREKAVEREAEQSSKTTQAITTLAKVAQDAGLPKPSEAGSEGMVKNISFGGNPVEIDARSEVLNAVKNTRDSLVRAFKTDAILRKNPRFDREMLREETAISPVEGASDLAERAGDLADALNAALDIDMRANESLRRMLED